MEMPKVPSPDHLRWGLTPDFGPVFEPLPIPKQEIPGFILPPVAAYLKEERQCPPAPLRAVNPQLLGRILQPNPQHGNRR